MTEQMTTFKYANVIFGRGAQRMLIKTFFGADCIRKAEEWLAEYIKANRYACADFSIRVIEDCE